MHRALQQSLAETSSLSTPTCVPQANTTKQPQVPKDPSFHSFVHIKFTPMWECILTLGTVETQTVQQKLREEIIKYTQFC